MTVIDALAECRACRVLIRADEPAFFGGAQSPRAAGGFWWHDRCRPQPFQAMTPPSVDTSSSAEVKTQPLQSETPALPDARDHSFFTRALQALGLPEPVTEHVFARPRRYRFDFAWPEHLLALEIEGGTFGKGEPCAACGRREGAAHSSVTGLLRDLEKYNLAVMRGWRVLRCIPGQETSTQILEQIKQLLEQGSIQ